MENKISRRAYIKVSHKQTITGWSLSTWTGIKIYENFWGAVQFEIRLSYQTFFPFYSHKAGFPITRYHIQSHEEKLTFNAVFYLAWENDLTYSFILHC